MTVDRDVGAKSKRGRPSVGRNRSRRTLGTHRRHPAPPSPAKAPVFEAPSRPDRTRPGQHRSEAASHNVDLRDNIRGRPRRARPDWPSTSRLRLRCSTLCLRHRRSSNSEIFEADPAKLRVTHTRISAPFIRHTSSDGLQKSGPPDIPSTNRGRFAMSSGTDSICSTCRRKVADGV